MSASGGFTPAQRKAHYASRAAVEGLGAGGIRGRLAGGGSDGQSLHVEVPLETGHTVEVRPNSSTEPAWQNHWSLSVQRNGTGHTGAGMVRFPNDGTPRTSAPGSENSWQGAHFHAPPADLHRHVQEFLGHPDVLQALRADTQKNRNLGRQF